MSTELSGAELNELMVKELIAEEKKKLDGPECADELHKKNLDMRIERRQLFGPKTMTLDPTYGHCTKCERTVRRDIKFANTPGNWEVTHGAGCKCSTCPWKLDKRK